MPATTHRSTPAPTLPLSVPSKGPAVQPYHAPARYGSISDSPPERAESVSTGGASYSVASSSYAGSAHEYDGGSSTSASGIDLLEYMHTRLSHTIDPIPLDRSLATQAQTSGELNAKTRELLALQALAKSRLKATKANFADGIKAAKEVQRDLEWTQKRVSALNQRAAQKYPAQYKVASAKYPTPIDC